MFDFGTQLHSQLTKQSLVSILLDDCIGEECHRRGGGRMFTNQQWQKCGNFRTEEK